MVDFEPRLPVYTVQAMRWALNVEGGWSVGGGPTLPCPRFRPAPGSEGSR
jgi:hypothetical protein